MEGRKNVESIGEAVSVLMQVAELAQGKGILTLDDAVIVKSAIDFINATSEQKGPVGEVVALQEE